MPAYLLFEQSVMVIGYRLGSRLGTISKLDADWFISILLDPTTDVAIPVTSCQSPGGSRLVSKSF